MSERTLQERQARARDDGAPPARGAPVNGGPTAVADVELEQLPPGLEGLGAATQALVLVRMRGAPVTEVRVPVEDGRVGAQALAQAVAEGTTPAVWRRWLSERVEAVRPPGRAARRATVAVIARDRPDELRHCLDALVRLPDDGQELLVLDVSNSGDAVRELVARHPGVRRVRPAEPGLSAARNRAVREARHEVVAFLDGDAAPDAGWLRALLANFDDPLVACVTGMVMPLELETPAQEWAERLQPQARRLVRRVHDAADTHPLRAPRAGGGANFALRRDAVARVGPFDEALGPGTPARGGAVTELWTRLLAAGERIVYDPAALAWRRPRRTWEELRQTVYDRGVGAGAAWSRSLAVDGEWAAIPIAFGVLVRDRLPTLYRSMLRRPGAPPLDLALAELRGCAAGPWAYWEARRGSGPRAAPPRDDPARESVS